jgi:hypothetical protein
LQTYPIWLSLLWGLACGCGDSKTTVVNNGPQGVSNYSGDKVVVSGQLALDTDAEEAAKQPDAELANRELELEDEAGNKVAAAATAQAGTFQLEIDTDTYGLQSTGSPFEVPRLFKLNSLFLIDGQDKQHAVGIQQSLFLDATRFSVNAEGEAVMEAGTQQVRKVGAIVGRIALETGGDAVGTDVYVPGTTHVAKTDADGRFLLGFLPAGTYTVRAERDGFVANEWTDITVEKGETTILGDVTLPIAVGPQISDFSLTSIDEATGEATVHIKLHAATKYRVSMLSDFSDTVFKPVDLSDPEFSIKLSLSAGFKVVQVYLEAADSDGLSANSTLVIDRDPPKLGAISPADSDGIINATSIPLVISAEGATKMKLAESLEGLAAASWVDYATSYSYQLTDTSDGSKTIFISFADDSGNTLGANGELSTSVTLDRTAPSDGAIALLRPESPTGAFNTPLAWQADYEESGIGYEIQVATDSAFTNVIRTMSTDDQTVNVNPPLASEGSYHWQVRAIDQAGNVSSWVSSSSASGTIFEVKILAEAYHAKTDIMGTAGRDRYFARELRRIQDVNGDGVTDLAYSILATDYSDGTTSCQDCGVVVIVDGDTQETIARLTDGLTKASGYGHRLVSCDLTGDGFDELVVSAPGHAISQGGATYNNAGAIYAYDLGDLSLLVQKSLDIGAQAYGYSSNNCSQMEGSTCVSYGYPMYPNTLDQLPWGDGRFFGWDLGCVERSGSADSLLVGEPKYHDGNGFIGRARVLDYSAGSLAVNATLVGDTVDAMFGAAVEHLNPFLYGACSTAGETIAVGLPRLAAGGNEKGSVYLYQPSGGNWTKCVQIDAAGDDPDHGNWGMRLSNLGDIAQDVDSNQELAVATGYWQGGAVRVYGGSGGSLLKSLRDTSSGWNRLGYRVVPAGDYDNDGQSELAISAPEAPINGQWGAGQVNIYRWSDIDDDDDNADGEDADNAPYLTIQGIPANSANLGATFVPVLTDSNDPHSATENSIIAAPGRNINGEWSVGSFHIFDLLKLAPSLPVRYEGVSTNARMGASIVSIGDADNDNVADLMIGQPGGRCDGKPYGMMSLFSVLDNTVTASICAANNGDDLGIFAHYLANQSRLVFFRNGSGYLVDRYNILDYRDISNSTDYPASRRINNMGWDLGSVSEPYRVDNSTSELLVNDPERHNNASKEGRVTMYKITWETSEECNYQGDVAEGYFGYSSSFITDLNGDGVRDLLVGAPGYEPAGATNSGRVWIIDGAKAGASDCNSSNSIVINDASAYVLGTIDVNNSLIDNLLGQEAESNFGSLVVGLPDFDGSGDALAYIYVANTNIRVDDSSVTPQFFIFAYNSDSSLSLVTYEGGDAGGMLGSYARVIEDINGDGVQELAVSSPQGSGRLGNTGNVRIFSGAGLATTGDSSDDLLQALFNPDATASNFGTAFEYADITGDGLKDFLIGADSYDSSAFQNAGAVYAFPMNPIQE